MLLRRRKKKQNSILHPENKKWTIKIWSAPISYLGKPRLWALILRITHTWGNEAEASQNKTCNSRRKAVFTVLFTGISCLMLWVYCCFHPRREGIYLYFLLDKRLVQLWRSGWPQRQVPRKLSIMVKGMVKTGSYSQEETLGLWSAQIT